MEDYIDHNHHLEERRELSHPDHLSTGSTDEDDEVSLRSRFQTLLSTHVQRLANSGISAVVCSCDCTGLYWPLYGLTVG